MGIFDRLSRFTVDMAEIRYGIAGSPVNQSLSPLLMAIVCDHLTLTLPSTKLSMEIIDATSIHDALAWGYAGAVPTPIEWGHTQAIFGKFRTRTLLDKALEAVRDCEQAHVRFSDCVELSLPPPSTDVGLPSRLFDDEIWLNLTSPLKHQLTTDAVLAIDDSMEIKSVNALRWDGKGWWCAGLDGQGVVDVFRCHGIDPPQAVLGVWGGGGAARSTVHAWVKAGGTVNMLGGRRELSDGPWDGHLVTTPPSVIVDFDGDAPDIPDCQYLQAAYAPLGGTVDEKAEHLTGRKLDGRWLLVAQHLACWRTLWCCERIHDLPSLSLLLTKLIQAETTLEQYA